MTTKLEEQWLMSKTKTAEDIRIEKTVFLLRIASARLQEATKLCWDLDKEDLIEITKTLTSLLRRYEDEM